MSFLENNFFLLAVTFGRVFFSPHLSKKKFFFFSKIRKKKNGGWYC